jgi:hypothetical protein
MSRSRSNSSGSHSSEYQDRDLHGAHVPPVAIDDVKRRKVSSNSRSRSRTDDQSRKQSAEKPSRSHRLHAGAGERASSSHKSYLPSKSYTSEFELVCSHNQLLASQEALKSLIERRHKRLCRYFIPALQDHFYQIQIKTQTTQEFTKRIKAMCIFFAGPKHDRESFYRTQDLEDFMMTFVREYPDCVEVLETMIGYEIALQSPAMLVGMDEKSIKKTRDPNYKAPLHLIVPQTPYFSTCVLHF